MSPRITRHSKKAINPVANDEAFKQLLEAALRGDSVGARCTIPCPDQFKVLALSKMARAGWMHKVERDIGPRLILPFLFLHDDTVVVRNVGELVSFVSINAETPLTHKAVAAAYVELALKVDALMSTNEKWQKSKLYDLGLLRAQFEEAGKK
jgi:hypothetical protein